MCAKMFTDLCQHKLAGSGKFVLCVNENALAWICSCSVLHCKNSLAANSRACDFTQVKIQLRVYMGSVLKKPENAS